MEFLEITYRAKAGDLPEQEIQVGVLLNSSKLFGFENRRAFVGKASTRVSGGLFLPRSLQKWYEVILER